MLNNGDTKREFKVGTVKVRGLGSFHKSLPHNKWGEVESAAFDALVAATEGDGSGFATVPKGTPDAAPLTNPQGGLATDRLTQYPGSYSMPPAPRVLSATTAAEMTELYWMALLRDVPFDQFDSDPGVAAAAAEVDDRFRHAITDAADDGHLKTGVDVPGPAGGLAPITSQNLFRLGLPGEEVGPLVSQFFVRGISYGTQHIDQMQVPYKKHGDFLVEFPDWLHAQSSGKDAHGQARQLRGQPAVHFHATRPGPVRE